MLDTGLTVARLVLKGGSLDLKLLVLLAEFDTLLVELIEPGLLNLKAASGGA